MPDRSAADPHGGYPVIDDASGYVAVEADEHVKPYVHEVLDAKSMHFSILEIQSRMQILRPDVLELEYTRTMMGLLVFKPEPERIAMIGLGGGSLAKFCHRHLPHASMLAVEINPHVIALREAFKVPPDGARFQVLEADGARFVAETGQRFDVLMVDAFDTHGMPPELGTGRFYDDCHDVLAPDGLMVVNLHAGHPHCPVYIDRIRRSFDGKLLRVDDADGSNAIVFAARGDGLRCAAGISARRPATLGAEPWAQLQGVFARVASALQASSAAGHDERPRQS